MQDGPLRIALKTVARWLWRFDLSLLRASRRLREPPRWRLGGACEGCARCCEAPTLRVGRLLWFLPRTRRVFLWWQRVVNGFELVEADRASRSFVFRCTHFDWQRRRCDSYASRPGICRDYPRVLLDQPWPELFEGCGFKVRAADAERQAQVLDDATLEQAGLDEAQRKALREKLRVD